VDKTPNRLLLPLLIAFWCRMAPNIIYHALLTVIAMLHICVPCCVLAIPGRLFGDCFHWEIALLQDLRAKSSISLTDLG